MIACRPFVIWQVDVGFVSRSFLEGFNLPAETSSSDSAMREPVRKSRRVISTSLSASMERFIVSTDGLFLVQPDAHTAWV
jgi:hypothetical protein